MGKILVTGAGGNVGAAVVESLQQLEQPVAAAIFSNRDAEKVPLSGNTGTVFFDFARPETFGPAFEDVDRLFLLRPPPISDVKRYLFPVIDHAKAVGVKQIAFLSLIGIEKNKIAPHYKVEKYLEAGSIPYTFIRPSFYMQNLNTTHRAEIKERNVISVPVGQAKTSFIDTRDIGAVAAQVLAEPGHENRAYELTGGEALDYYQVAEIFSRVLGRKITYTNPSIPRFFLDTVRNGTPVGFAAVMVGLYTATRFGTANRVTDDLERLLGRPPISMRQYVEDYAEYWQ